MHHLLININNFMESNTNPVMPSVIPAKIDGPITLFSLAWSLFKSNWKIILAIIALPGVLFAIAQIFFIVDTSMVSIVVGVLLMIAGAIASIVSQPAAIDAINKISSPSGQIIDLKTEYKIGLGFFWSVLLLSIMQGLISIGAAVFLIIPAIIVGVFLSMYMFTLVIEGKKGFGSLLESYNLVNGRWFGVFGRLIFMALVFIGIAIIMAGVTAVIQFLFDISTQSMSYSILTIVSNFIMSTIVGSLSVTYLYKLYISLKANPVPSISTNTFKKFLIGFMVVGVIVLVFFIVAGIFFGGLYVADNFSEISNTIVK